MPGGPYDLWRERRAGPPGERHGRRIRPVRLNCLRCCATRRSRTRSCRASKREFGWGARMRPDKTFKTYWRTRVDDTVLREPGLEVCLPESATLSDLDPALLAFQVLPDLWPVDEISVQSVHDYFAGGHSPCKYRWKGTRTPFSFPHVSRPRLMRLFRRR